MWSKLCELIGQVMHWIYSYVPNYGLAIILFTVLLKVVLLPLAIKQHKSSLAMVKMKPYQDELMKKYGSNRQKYSEELQKLYQREGYNPMSSCLPMLIQMPLLFMMYTIIRRPLHYMAGWSLTQIWQSSVSEFGTKIIEIKGNATTILAGGLEKYKITAENFNSFESQILSNMKKPPIETNFLGLNLANIPSEVWKVVFLILLIPVISGATSFLLSWLSQKMSPAQQASEQAGSMKTMLLLMPLMSLWIAFTVPAGLGLYWIISNLIGIAQLYLLNALYNPKKLEEEVYAKIEAEKQREKAKKSESARKKAMAMQGKKKKKKNAPKTGE